MKASKNKLDFEREFKPFGELYSLLSIETGEKTELIFLYNKDGIIEEDLKYYKQDLTHIKGNLYKSDDGKIFEKEIKYKYATRTAISELDFNIIFDREFQKRVDEPQKRDEPNFAKILLKELNENKNVFNNKKEYFLLRKATDYFIEYLENKKNGLLSQQTKNEHLKTEINTFCKSMPLSIPKEHFKVFTRKNSKNKKPFLTTEQYNAFIERAFNGNIDILKQKFNQIPKGEKLLIQAEFYDFYNKHCMDYFNSMQCQPEFIRLLTENFTGWDFKNVSNNFTPKTKKRL